MKINKNSSKYTSELMSLHQKSIDEFKSNENQQRIYIALLKFAKQRRQLKQTAVEKLQLLNKQDIETALTMTLDEHMRDSLRQMIDLKMKVKLQPQQ